MCVCAFYDAFGDVCWSFLFWLVARLLKYLIIRVQKLIHEHRVCMFTFQPNLPRLVEITPRHWTVWFNPYDSTCQNSQNYSNTKWPRLVEVTSRWLPGTQWKYWLCASWQSFLFVGDSYYTTSIFGALETAAFNQLLAEWISWNLAKGINPVKPAISLAELLDWFIFRSP